VNELWISIEYTVDNSVKSDVVSLDKNTWNPCFYGL